MNQLLLYLLLLGVPSFSNATSWPEIRSINKSYQFQRGDSASLNTRIVSKAGTPLYMIRCEGPAPVGEDPSAGANDFVFSGDFECRLYSLEAKEKTEYPTLFTELSKMDRDWQSRARFLTTELVGICGEIIDFGRKRTFRVRGMQITLELTDVKLKSQGGLGLKSFAFKIILVNDPTANRDITLPPLRVANVPGCELNNSAQY